jgi:H+/gluconate symporter-like permease
MQIQNLIPMPHFRTTPFAAPGLGIIGGACIFVLGMLWLNGRARSAARNNEGYASVGLGPGDNVAIADDEPLPAFGLAMAPIVVVLVCNFVAAKFWIPTWQTSYLGDDQFGRVTVDAVRGIWSSIMALLAACGMVILSSPRCRRRISEILRTAALDSLLPVFNTGSEVGYGAVIAALPAFVIIKNAILDFVPSNPLVSEAVAINVLAGITGSASGGLTIALEALGDTYYQRALDLGMSPDVMHRVASMASGGLDSLPHNGAVITLLTICGLTHRQSYLDIGVVTVVIPLIALALVIALASLQLAI